MNWWEIVLCVIGGLVGAYALVILGMIILVNTIFGWLMHK